MNRGHVEAQLCLLPAQRLGFLICRVWPQQNAVTVKVAHFIPEDSPEEVVGSATATIVTKVLAGQIR
jgi:hypothetical protein